MAWQKDRDTPLNYRVVGRIRSNKRTRAGDITGGIKTGKRDSANPAAAWKLIRDAHCGSWTGKTWKGKGKVQSPGIGKTVFC
jgi:hypothetical protein